jgi:hypothetical protein
MKTKTFDAVKMMRELRDKLSLDMEHMTPEERVRYIREKAKAFEINEETAPADNDDQEMTE